MKNCTRCHELKPLTEFHKKSSAKDKVATICKVCLNSAQHLYHKNLTNREKITRRRNQREYYLKNKERIALYHRERNNRITNDPILNEIRKEKRRNHIKKLKEQKTDNYNQYYY